jgi:hypothetical protein
MKPLAISAKTWCVANHFVGYARQAHNPSRNKPSRIDKRMPFFDDFVVADFHRANFREAIPGRPAAGSFHIDDDIIQLGVKAVVDFADLRWNASVHELPQPRELITPYRIAFRFDLHKRDRTAFREHQIGKAVAHGEEIFAYQTQDGGNALQARAIEKSPQKSLSKPKFLPYRRLARLKSPGFVRGSAPQPLNLIRVRALVWYFFFGPAEFPSNAHRANGTARSRALPEPIVPEEPLAILFDNAARDARATAAQRRRLVGVIVAACVDHD